MFDCNLDQLKTTVNRAIQCIDKSASHEVFLDLLSAATPGCQNRLRIAKTFKAGTTPNFEITSEYIAMQTVESRKTSLLGLPYQDIVGFTTKNASVLGAFFEESFFQLLCAARSSSTKFMPMLYIGRYCEVDARTTVHMTDCPFPAGTGQIDLNEGNKAAHYINNYPTYWIRPGVRNETWDAAILQNDNYLLVTQLTITPHAHKINFGVISELVTELKNLGRNPNFVEVAFILPSVQKAESISLNPEGVMPKNCKVVNGGPFISADSFSTQFNKNWPCRGYGDSSDAVMQISMYVMDKAPIIK